MKYLKVTNWDVWQTYRKDRAQPQWIKVHRALLRNMEWHSLTDSQKGHVVSIWMLAADKDGEFPADPVIIKKFCGLETEPDLQALERLGFISGCHADNHDGCGCADIMTAQKRVEERRTDGDGDKVATKKKTQKKDDGSTEIAQAMADEWNRIFGTNRGPTSTLVKAVKSVRKIEKGVTQSDFVLVVRSRSTEGWVTETRPLIESLIRTDKFAGYLEKARETAGPARSKYSEQELSEMRTLTGGGGQ